MNFQRISLIFLVVLVFSGFVRSFAPAGSGLYGNRICDITWRNGRAFKCRLPQNEQEEEILTNIAASQLQSDLSTTQLVETEVEEEDDNIIATFGDLQQNTLFLAKAALIGLCTAIGVVLFKLSIQETSKIFYENLADALPKPVFYWPQILYPVLGSAIVSILTYSRGLSIRNGIDSIAQSIDSVEPFNPTTQLYRVGAAVATLGSGCSLGPEGPAVEIGAGLSRLIGSNDTARHQHFLFLAGTAAGVSAGFNAPIAGVFFAIECGNRFLKSNTIKLDEESPDGPRADIAAIVLAATVAKVVVELGLQESNALSIQGNSFAMQSPLFELPLYLGLGLFSGLISTTFSFLREFFTDLFLVPDSSSLEQYDAANETDNENSSSSSSSSSTNEIKKLVSRIPIYARPLLGGLLCGCVALYYPQTVFVGYSTLDQLLAGKIQMPTEFLFQLLVLKVFLSTFSLGTGLIGGVFAPSLFFGAIAGTIYHDALCFVLQNVNSAMGDSGMLLSIASAPAYATVGAAATLGALFRAPLTSTILMLELTENHDIVLPVLVSSGIAGFFAEIVRKRPKRAAKSFKM